MYVYIWESSMLNCIGTVRCRSKQSARHRGGCARCKSWWGTTRKRNPEWEGPSRAHRQAGFDIACPLSLSAAAVCICV